MTASSARVGGVCLFIAGSLKASFTNGLAVDDNLLAIGNSASTGGTGDNIGAACGPVGEILAEAIV